ncbi:MAG: hypothetical protein LBC39_05530 [Methanobrevibacter sp.]|jgi:hypothetical protein|nr:hypothetical protein [Candidatus Methanovirga aequatorialis]
MKKMLSMITISLMLLSCIGAVAATDQCPVGSADNNYPIYFGNSYNWDLWTGSTYQLKELPGSNYESKVNIVKQLEERGLVKANHPYYIDYPIIGGISSFTVGRTTVANLTLYSTTKTIHYDPFNNDFDSYVIDSYVINIKNKFIIF